MLRASTETTEDSEPALRDFVDAAIDRGPALDAARARLRDQLGEGALTDAAGVLATFQRMVRLADATGL